MAAASSPPPYLECRQFDFQGMPGRTIGMRPATLDDLDTVTVLAQLAYEWNEGGASHCVHQFCWNRHQDFAVVFRDGLERSLRDVNKRVYVVEDTSQQHEILAASIIILGHGDDRAQSDTPEIKYGPAYARWTHYQDEMSRMRGELGTNRHVHIQELFTHPKYSHQRTRDPQNPDPFLAKALFLFISTQSEEVRLAPEISAIVPVPAGSWLYGRLGFEPVSGRENQKRLLPPETPEGVSSRGGGDGEDPEYEYETHFVDVGLFVWRRQASVFTTVKH